MEDREDSDNGYGSYRNYGNYPSSEATNEGPGIFPFLSIRSRNPTEEWAGNFLGDFAIASDFTLNGYPVYKNRHLDTYIFYNTIFYNTTSLCGGYNVLDNNCLIVFDVNGQYCSVWNAIQSRFEENNDIMLEFLWEEPAKEVISEAPAKLSVLSDGPIGKKVDTHTMNIRKKCENEKFS